MVNFSAPIEIRNRLARAELSAFEDLSRRPTTVGTSRLLERWRWLIDRVGVNPIFESEWISLLRPRRHLASVLHAAQAHGSMEVLSWFVPLVDGLDDEFRLRTSPGWLSSHVGVDEWWERRVAPEHARGSARWTVAHIRNSRSYGPLEVDPTLRSDFVGADFDVVDLASASLAHQDLAGADLSGRDLSGVDLTGADLSRADLRGAVIGGAELEGAILTLADCDELDAVGASGRKVVARLISLRDGNLRNANLPGIDASGANVRGADLSDADLSDGSLVDAELGGATLDRARLIGVDLTRAAVPNASFVEADLDRALLDEVRRKGHTSTGGPFDGALNVKSPNPPNT